MCWWSTWKEGVMKTGLEDGAFTVWWKIPAIGETSATNVSCTLKTMVSPQCFGKSLNCVEWKNRRKIPKISMLATTVYIHKDSSCILLSGSVFWTVVYCSVCLRCLVRKKIIINKRLYEWLLYKWLRKEKVFSMLVCLWCFFFLICLFTLS